MTKATIILAVLLAGGCVAPNAVQVTPQAIQEGATTTQAAEQAQAKQMDAQAVLSVQRAIDNQQKGVLNVNSYGSVTAMVLVTTAAVVCMTVVCGFATKRPHPKKVKHG